METLTKERPVEKRKSPAYVSTLDMSHDEWIRSRKAGIGGSDAAKILGVSNYGTAVDVWLDKTDQVPEIEDNDLMWFGREVEPVIAKRFEQETGRSVQNDYKIRLHPEHDFIMANMDRVILGDDQENTGVLECKSTSEFARQSWGNDVDINPAWYVQVQHYLLVTGYEYGYIAYLVDRKYHQHRVEADAELHAMMIDRYQEFWECVQNRTPPRPVSGDDIDKLYKSHTPGKSAECDESVYKSVCDLINLKEEIKELEQQKKDLESTIKIAIEDSESLEYNGNVLATYKEVVTNRLNGKALKETHPEIAEKFTKPSSYRRLTLKTITEL